MTQGSRLVRMVLGWVRRRPVPAPTPTASADPPGPPVPDEVVNDEKTRIEDLRTVAKWQLAALGAVATAVFAGVVLNRLPNPADPADGGWGALWTAGLGALLALVCITVMISLVGWVLAPQYRSLEEQLSRKQRGRGRRPWYDQPTLYLPYPEIRTLKMFLTTREQAYADHVKLASKPRRSPDEEKTLAALELAFTSYYNPVGVRLNWRNRRELVAERARTALVALGGLGGLSALGILLYLGAVSYHRPDTTAVHTLNLPAYGLWRPLSAKAPRLSRDLLASDLGARCPVTAQTPQGQPDRSAGVQVMVLEETPADHTFLVLVTAPGCTPRLYTVPQAEVTASAPFELPSP